jgi:hypothetical protein
MSLPYPDSLKPPCGISEASGKRCSFTHTVPNSSLRAAASEYAGAVELAGLDVRDQVMFGALAHSASFTQTCLIRVYSSIE